MCKCTLNAQAHLFCMHEQYDVCTIEIWLGSSQEELNRRISESMPVSADNPQGRTWIFVVNNWDEEDIKWVMALECNKIVCSKECGEEGTPHLQGTVSFKRNYTFAQLKKLHGKAHWEIAYAAIDFNYCKKLGGEIIRDEDGAKKGKRTDLDQVREWLEEGDTMFQVVKKAKSVQTISFARAWFQYNDQHLPMNTKIEIFWYYGTSGVGKTKKVLEETMGHSLFIPTSFKWWDGYEGEDKVLIDDLRPTWCSPDQLLRLLDPYRFKYRVEIKGSSRPLLATKIFITCPWHPNDFWRDSPEDPKQLLRRLTLLVHFRSDGQWVQPLC